MRENADTAISMMSVAALVLCLLALAVWLIAGAQRADAQPLQPPVGLPYAIVDTGQTGCTDDRGRAIAPRPGQPFYGQDAQYQGLQPSYRDHGDGTVNDLNTGLMWVQARGAKVTWEAAGAGAAACRTGGYTDWRMPTIKELYSLINFSGGQGRTVAESRPTLTPAPSSSPTAMKHRASGSLIARTGRRRST